MAFMGYETPVEMPSMGVYNTDLMKMYIAGVKEQYDLAREEMKDFTKLYLLFNSDLPGQALLYNDLTVGGALKLIGDLYSRGIDPYKSPEARAVIALYINSAPIGKLKEMERSAENAKIYKQNLVKAVNDPNWDPDYNRYMIGGDLETWDPNKPWTATTPYLAPDLKETVVPYLQQFKKDENLGPTPNRNGYIRFGTSELNQRLGISGALERYANSPYGLYKYLQAVEAANSAVHSDGTPLTDEEKAAYVLLVFLQPIRSIATQFFQPKDELDPLYKDRYEANLNIATHEANNKSDWKYKLKEYLYLIDHPELNKKSKTGKTSSTGGGSDSDGSYSHYVGLNSDHLQHIQEMVKKVGIAGNNGKIAKGSIALKYKWNNKTGELLIEDNNGKIKTTDGKHYRLATTAEMLAIILQKCTKDDWVSKLSIHDVAKTSEVNISENIEQYEQLLYSYDQVAKAAEGSYDLLYGEGEKFETNKDVRGKFKTGDSLIKSSRNFINVYLKNGKKASYIPVYKGTNKALLKIDEQELYMYNGQPIWISTPEFSRMRDASDKLISTGIVGQRGSDDISNVNIEDEDE